MSTHAPPLEGITDFEAMQELKAINAKESITLEETERAISLVRLLRRNTAGPSEAKKAKSKKADYASKSIDDLLA